MSDSFEQKISLDSSSHPRLSEFNRLVYPVVSRRAGGLSLGINLNPSKTCSYNCVYCQVDRSVRISGLEVDITKIEEELEYWLMRIADREDKFGDLEVRDIAIAGDGEPTLSKHLPGLIIRLVEIKKKHNLKECKLVLFTNGSKIHRTDLWEVLPAFFANNGQIWYKLDCWDEESYHIINRSAVPFSRIVDNLTRLGTQFPVTLQSCFFSWENHGFSVNDYKPYVDLIKKLQGQGVHLELIQSYTLARIPAESSARPWSDKEMDELHEFLKSHLNIPIKTIYKTGVKDS